jgi:hypothetical protein
MNLTLVRDYRGPDCTLGRLSAGPLVLQTLELPWVPDSPNLCGKRDVSCLPAALYQLALHDSPRLSKCFALVNEALQVYHLAQDIPRDCYGRTTCLIHAGNYVRDIEGCIIVGRERRMLQESGWMITESRDSLAQFQNTVPWVEGHTLQIS